MDFRYKHKRSDDICWKTRGVSLLMKITGVLLQEDQKIYAQKNFHWNPRGLTLEAQMTSIGSPLYYHLNNCCCVEVFDGHRNQRIPKELLLWKVKSLTILKTKSLSFSRRYRDASLPGHLSNAESSNAVLNMFLSHLV